MDAGDYTIGKIMRLFCLTCAGIHIGVFHNILFIYFFSCKLKLVEFKQSERDQQAGAL